MPRKTLRIIFAVLAASAFPLFLASSASAAQVNTTVICGKSDGTQRSFQIGWNNSTQFFQNRGYIPRLFCEGGYAAGFNLYVSDTLTDPALGYYNGISPETTTTNTPAPETSPAASPAPTETATASASPSPTPSETPAPSPSPTAEPSPTPTPEPSSEPSVTPTPTASETATPEATPQTSQTETPTATTPPPSPDSSTATSPETSTVVNDTPPAVVEPAPAPQPVAQPEPVRQPEPIPAPIPAPAPIPDPIPAPAPEVVPDVVPVPEPEPAPTEEPPLPPTEPTPTEPPAPVTEPAPSPEPAPVSEPVAEPASPVSAPVPNVVENSTKSDPVQITAETDLRALAPDTPVQLENGVIITAEVAVALQVLDNPAQLIGEIFSNPAEVFTALSNIGADMSPKAKEKSKKAIVSAVIVGGIASQAASSATYRRKP